jgi:hypothetical protein
MTVPSIAQISKLADRYGLPLVALIFLSAGIWRAAEWSASLIEEMARAHISAVNELASTQEMISKTLQANTRILKDVVASMERDRERTSRMIDEIHREVARRPGVAGVPNE